jgi:hypothetical protein
MVSQVEDKVGQQIYTPNSARLTVTVTSTGFSFSPKLIPAHPSV